MQIVLLQQMLATVAFALFSLAVHPTAGTLGKREAGSYKVRLGSSRQLLLSSISDGGIWRRRRVSETGHTRREQQARQRALTWG